MTSRVLHVLSQRPGWTGSGVGTDALVRTIAREASWEQAVVVGTPPDDPQPSVGDLPQDRVFPLVFESDALPFRLPGMSDVMPYPSTQFSTMTVAQLDAYRIAWRRHVSQAVSAFRPDVIHGHHVWLLSAMLKDIAATVPTVIHCHGTGLRQLSLSPHLANEVRAGCARNDGFLALHHQQADAMMIELGVSAERVHVIGNGFRDDLFHARQRPATQTSDVAYVGKLSRAKGLPWLLDAIERIAQTRSHLTLHIAGSGSGPESDAIRRRIEAIPCVQFHGQLDQPQLAEMLRRCHTFALPSFFEGLPLVLVEAAACGCRLVATDLPGIVDQLQPVLGDTLQTIATPRLINTDQPVDDDLPGFVDRLTAAINDSLDRPAVDDPAARVAGMTWQAVSRRIQDVWRWAMDQ